MNKIRLPYQFPSLKVNFNIMKINHIKTQFKFALIQSFADAQSRKLKARLLFLVLQPVFFAGNTFAAADGLATIFSNLEDATKIGIKFLVAVGVIAGLGLILGGLFSMYKKYERGNDDITWGTIGLQIASGGLAMALAFVGVLVVQTLGGEEDNIGKVLGA